MSEGVATHDGVSAGTLLRQAREAAGLHVSTLAANLKVPVRKLEALEEDRYDLLPDAVFVRALASSVCRTLKVEAQPVLERLPQTEQPRLMADRERINAPFRAPSDGPGPGWMDQVSRPVVLIVAALLLGALVLVFLPYVQSGYETVSQAVQEAQTAPTATTATAASQPVAVQAPIPAAEPPVAADAQATATATATVLAQGPDSSIAASTPMAAPQQPAASAAGSAAAVPPMLSAPIPADGVLAFRTKAPSWIQVTDATGAAVFRKLMEAGEAAGVSGTLPLSVTIGNVAATEVEVRGKAYNLGPVSKDNVARFQVK
jgi:cytoskeleton protein RodZ